jgi:pSer/pThr/pTyr-binding forkhead associated (FHA) protein
VFKLAEDGGYTVTDLGSMGGTWINGYKIPADTPQPVESGCRISFGSGSGGASYIFEL